MVGILDIRETYWRQGYGSFILKQVLQDYPELYVQSIMNSEDFYAKNDFKILDDEDDLIMVATDKYDILYKEWQAGKAEAKAYCNKL